MTTATFVYVGNTDSNAIHVLQLDRRSGDLTLVEKVDRRHPCALLPEDIQRDFAAHRRTECAGGRATEHRAADLERRALGNPDAPRTDGRRRRADASALAGSEPAVCRERDRAALRGDAALRESGLSAEDVDKILNHNAQTVLGLEH
jgi:hypothetical protein